MTTPQPTQDGFSNWLYQVVGIPVEWLPTDSVVIGYAYEMALATVNPVFRCVPGPIFLAMVYNLATHFLVLWAPDPTTTPPYPYKNIEGETYGFFEWTRKQNGMLGFTAGVVQSATDNGTGTSLLVPDAFKNLTLSQLGLTSSPWGRTYLGYAMDVNTPWGIS